MSWSPWDYWSVVWNKDEANCNFCAMFSRFRSSWLHPWLDHNESLNSNCSIETLTLLFFRKKKNWLVLDRTIGTPLLDGALLPWGIPARALYVSLKLTMSYESGSIYCLMRSFMLSCNVGLNLILLMHLIWLIVLILSFF